MKYIFPFCMSFVFFSHWEGLCAEVILEKHEIIRPQVVPMKNSWPHKVWLHDVDNDGTIDIITSHVSWGKSYIHPYFGWYERVPANKFDFHEFDKEDNQNDIMGGHNCELVDVDGDGDEDLIVGGVDVKDMTQRFRWYENIMMNGHVKWIEHPIGVTSAAGWKPEHGFYCGEMAWGDIDRDGDLDLVYSGQGSGFLGWFENKTK